MTEWLCSWPDWALVAVKIWAVINAIGIAGVIGFHLREDVKDDAAV